MPFARWVERNVRPHRVAGYASVTLSLKKPGTARRHHRRRWMPPPICRQLQLRRTARHARAEPGARRRRTAPISSTWQGARAAGFATPNIGLLTDMICCPGGDFCDLANARSIPVAKAVQARFDDLDYLWDIGDIELNISGCMNSCGPPPRRPHRHPRRR